MTDKMPEVGEELIKAIKNGKSARELMSLCTKWIESNPKLKEAGDRFYKESLEEYKKKQLSNALESNAKLNEIKKEELEIQKPKSIWKPVSELPEKDCQLLVRLQNGMISFVYYSNKSFLAQESAWIPVRRDDPSLGSYESKTVNIGNDVKEWCSLTDFVNFVMEKR